MAELREKGRAGEDSGGSRLAGSLKAIARNDERDRERCLTATATRVYRRKVCPPTKSFFLPASVATIRFTQAP